MTKRIVFFGGTFDPVHNGHMIVARSLVEQCGFERVSFVPTAIPPHKAVACALAEDRLEMLRLAIEGEEIFDICEDELRRTGPSYTFDTLTQLRRRYGDKVQLHWVVGADMLEDFPKWYRASQVIELAGIVIATRPPWNERLDEIFSKLRNELSPEAVEKLQKAVIETPLIDISSTIIRKRVAEGKSIRYFLPDSVRKYIEKRRIYRNSGAK